MLGWMRRLLVDDPRTREELEVIPQLRAQVAELESDLEEWTGEVAAHTRTIDEYRDRQAELSRRLTAAELDRDTARTELAAARGQVEELTRRLRAAECEREAAKARTTAIALQQGRDAAAMSALTAERDQLRVTVASLRGHANLVGCALRETNGHLDDLFNQLNAAREAKS